MNGCNCQDGYGAESYTTGNTSYIKCHDTSIYVIGVTDTRKDLAISNFSLKYLTTLKEMINNCC